MYANPLAEEPFPGCSSGSGTLLSTLHPRSSSSGRVGVAVVVVDIGDVPQINISVAASCAINIHQRGTRTELARNGETINKRYVLRLSRGVGFNLWRLVLGVPGG